MDGIMGHLPSDLLKEYKQAFDMLDRKHCGKISIQDICTTTFSIGIQLSKSDINVITHDIIGLNADVNPMARWIEFPTFLYTMAMIITGSVSTYEITEIFNKFDEDGDGFISPTELRNLLLRLGDDFTESDIEKMINEADLDGDGVVSLDEFINVIQTSTATNLVQEVIKTSPLLDTKRNISAEVSIPEIYFTSEEDFENENVEERSVSETSEASNDCSSEPENSKIHKIRRRSRRGSIIKWLKKRSRLNSTSAETTIQ